MQSIATASGEWWRFGNFYIMKNDEVPEWLTQAGQNADALIRSAWPIIRAAKEAIDQARGTQDEAGPVLASGADVALAVDAGMAEVTAAVHRLAMDRIKTASASLLVTPTLVADADVAGAVDALAVAVQDGSSAPAVPVDLVTVARLLLVLIVLILPLAETRLSPDEQQMLTDYMVVFGVALPLDQIFRNNRKR